MASDGAALLLSGIQNAIDDPSWQRNNPPPKRAVHLGKEFHHGAAFVSRL
jgi:hypothetical protein